MAFRQGLVTPGSGGRIDHAPQIALVQQNILSIARHAPGEGRPAGRARFVNGRAVTVSAHRFLRRRSQPWFAQKVGTRGSRCVVIRQAVSPCRRIGAGSSPAAGSTRAQSRRKARNLAMVENLIGIPPPAGRRGCAAPIESDTVRFLRAPIGECRRENGGEFLCPRCHRLRDTGVHPRGRSCRVKTHSRQRVHRFTTAPGNHLPAGRKASVTGGSPRSDRGRDRHRAGRAAARAGRPGRSAPQRRGARNGRHRPVIRTRSSSTSVEGGGAASKIIERGDAQAETACGRVPSKTRLSASAPPSRSVSA